MFKGGKINTNIWIYVYCCNALQLKKRNPGWCLVPLDRIFEESIEEDEKFMMTG